MFYDVKNATFSFNAIYQFIYLATVVTYADELLMFYFMRV